jgi:hypothetical protein
MQPRRRKREIGGGISLQSLRQTSRGFARFARGLGFARSTRGGTMRVEKIGVL